MRAAEPFLLAMGRTVIHCGESGAGAAAKVRACWLDPACQIEVSFEALLCRQRCALIQGSPPDSACLVALLQ